MHHIEIRIRNITPTMIADYDKIIEQWKMVGAYFTNKNLQFSGHKDIKISLDVSNVVKKLNYLKDENCEAYFNKIMAENKFENLEELVRFYPLGTKIIIKISKKIDKEKLQISHFLEQLFLAMNLTLSGSCNFFEYDIIDNKGNEFLKSSKSLSSGLFEGASYLNNGWKWPNLQKNELIPTWEWLERHQVRSFILAKSSVQKACAILLSLSSKNMLEATDIIGLSQVLESFLLKKNEPKTRGLDSKIKTIFGSPKTEQNWITKLYKLRSLIAHGDSDILRPNYYPDSDNDKEAYKHYEDCINYIDKGLLIIMGILKELASHNKSEYTFTYKISMDME